MDVVVLFPRSMDFSIVLESGCTWQSELQAVISSIGASGGDALKVMQSVDLDGNGTIDFDEFCRALERFGLHMKESRKGVGGLSRSEAQALFDKYDSDGSGYLSYTEFADALIGKEA